MWKTMGVPHGDTGSYPSADAAGAGGSDFSTGETLRYLPAPGHRRGRLAAMTKKHPSERVIAALFRSPEKMKAWQAANLPDIVIVADIRHPEHPLGRYFPEKNLIEFSALEMCNYAPEVQRFAIAHEIGHWLCVTTFPTDYPKASPESEKFPDAFARFFLRRGNGDTTRDPFDEILSEEKFALLVELAEECMEAVVKLSKPQKSTRGN
jgi:hypothetical protein